MGEAGKGEGPVDLRPAERARHGRRAPDLQARAGKAERRKPDIETIRPQAALVDLTSMDGGNATDCQEQS